MNGIQKTDYFVQFLDNKGFENWTFCPDFGCFSKVLPIYDWMVLGYSNTGLFQYMQYAESPKSIWIWSKM